MTISKEVGDNTGTVQYWQGLLGEVMNTLLLKVLLLLRISHIYRAFIMSQELY
jgi:hypothetical protein